jgi:hypothetical protein
MRVIFDKLGLDNRVEPALWYEVRRREMMHEARAEISATVPKGRQVGLRPVRLPKFIRQSYFSPCNCCDR